MTTQTQTVQVESVNIPGYQIVNLIGQGGMGKVYLAVQLNLDRYVALKVIPRNSVAWPYTKKEARHNARVDHPNIVTVYTSGIHGEYFYIAMEHLPGRTLKERLVKHELSFDRVLVITKQLAQALHQMHEKGIVHRDIKPTNILFRNDGTPALADFGVAKSLRDISSTEDCIVGTLAYMPPEQKTVGHHVGPSADMYSLGLVLRDMLEAVSFDYLADVDQALRSIADCLTSAEPRKRYTAEQLVREVARVQYGLRLANNFGKQIPKLIGVAALPSVVLASLVFLANYNTEDLSAIDVYDVPGDQLYRPFPDCSLPYLQSDCLFSK